MGIKLLDITTEELLEKFGAGNHKPGSGSDAAFQGMISAKLLVTVINLTNEKKRRKRYSKNLPKLLEMESDIQNRIFPELTKLFQEDSIQFDKTIKLREQRDLEKDPIKHNKLSRLALKELKVAIDIPIEISRLCVELTEIANFVFDHAFRSARGDSQVALSGSVSAIAGCLSIIQLNLLSFRSDEYEWIEDTMLKVESLKNKYRNFSNITDSKISILEKEVNDKKILYKEVDQFLKKYKSKKNLSDKDIEESSVELQRLIWKNRYKIWKVKVPQQPTKVLIPGTVLKKIFGYEFHDVAEIGSENNIAGIINQEEKIVMISDEFPKNTQNFTAAHELGHAILHTQKVMHRDKPIDGFTSYKNRDYKERQADKFATFFLMPEKLVKQTFKELFLTDKFQINEDSAFFLTGGNPSELRKECKNSRGLARKLANAEFYSNQSFISISKLFNVSVEAMAIRIEELDLIEF
ncbi:cyclodeaminase/cyclohydrolase family protein [Kordia algicida OT-1]|uniref:Methenyltetrahydrofolate cyclohydrolase n=1 Tax=Kordia algicida OT-1 TaxID=391587 RepID=A9DSH6_9FLAO|nr:cyclodeaminase/cyclohydrolase family protein [Kordia algicida]EDP96936.1 hypothetical protein KAOT1_17273 [Kordia algicida OT-1]